MGQRLPVILGRPSLLRADRFWIERSLILRRLLVCLAGSARGFSGWFYLLKRGLNIGDQNGDDFLKTPCDLPHHVIFGTVHGFEFDLGLILIILIENNLPRILLDKGCGKGNTAMDDSSQETSPLHVPMEGFQNELQHQTAPFLLLADSMEEKRERELPKEDSLDHFRNRVHPKGVIRGRRVYTSGYPFRLGPVVSNHPDSKTVTVLFFGAIPRILVEAMIVHHVVGGLSPNGR